MTNLTKKDDNSSFSLTKGKLTSKQSSFRSRIAEAKNDTVDPNTMPNRICLMLDCSGSMQEHEQNSTRIDLLKEAVQNFVQRCNFGDTSIAIETFPRKRESEEMVKLSASSGFIIALTMGLQPGGGTPLRECVERSLDEVPMTRAVIVSDGGATDWYDYFDRIEKIFNPGPVRLYKDQKIPIDCVHISQDQDGEELLKLIAKETGGMFIKFTDVSSFSKAFGYLTPGARALLTSGSVTAEEIGAKELQK